MKSRTGDVGAIDDGGRGWAGGSLDNYAGCCLSYPEIWARVDLGPVGDGEGGPGNIKTLSLVKYQRRLDGSRLAAGGLGRDVAQGWPTAGGGSRYRGCRPMPSLYSVWMLGWGQASTEYTEYPGPTWSS